MRKNSSNIGTEKGFTLVELSVVLVIIGLVATIGVSTAKDAIEVAKQSATQNRMDTIERALFAFWKKNGRMPCPADVTMIASNANYGVEATNSATCSSGATYDGSGIRTADTTPPTTNYISATNLYKAVEGGVPVMTLGLPKDFVYDGWGKKIAYAVTPIFAQPGASTKIFPKNGICSSDNGITVKDAAGSIRSNSAVYALISYGKKGHGGYSKSGTRFNAGSTNTNELTNCHCTNTAVNSTYDGNYVQRSFNLNATTIANYFDDIVRFKELWQISTSEDSINDDGYRGPDLAIAYQAAGTGTVYAYKNGCGGFVKQADLNPLPTQKPLGVGFTTGNKHLLTYSFLGCNLYKIANDGTLTNQTSAFATNCTYNASGAMVLSDNGYLAIADTTNIKFWKLGIDAFTKLETANDLVNSNTLLSFSPNARYLAALPTAAGTTVPLYRRGSDKFTAVASPPTHSGGATAKLSVAFSPDGKYLAATSSTSIYLWRVLENGAFAALTTIDLSATVTNLSGITFSPDGRYFAVGKAQTPYLIIYKIDANDTFTALPDPSGPTAYPTVSTGTAFAFSKDSNYLVMITADTTYPAMLFQKNSVTSYIYKPYPFPVGVSPTTAFDSILSGASGGAVAFSK